MSFEWKPGVMRADHHFNRKEMILPLNFLCSSVINHDLLFSTIPAGNSSFFKVCQVRIRHANGFSPILLEEKEEC